MTDHTDTSDEDAAQNEGESRIVRLKNGASKTDSFAMQKSIDMGDAVASAASGDVLL